MALGRTPPCPSRPDASARSSSVGQGGCHACSSWETVVESESFTRKPWWRRWFGTRSERAAACFLRRLGYRIVARNWSCKLGELDLVALDGACVVFVEVRSTQTGPSERPAASVGAAKQRRLTSLALCFLQQKKLLNYMARFDVVVIRWPPGQREPTVVHFPHAFEAVGEGHMFR